MVQGTLYKMKIFHQQSEMKFKVKTSKVLRWEHDIFGAETWALRKVNEKQLKVVQMCCRKMTIKWTDRE